LHLQRFEAAVFTYCVTSSWKDFSLVTAASLLHSSVPLDNCQQQASDAAKILPLFMLELLTFPFWLWFLQARRHRR